LYTIREEIVEIPTENSNKRFVKKIIKSIIRINPTTGEKEIVDETSIDKPIEQFDQPISTLREEIVEAPSEEPGKKRFIKKIMRYFIKINPLTGEKEIIDGQQNSVISTKEEIEEVQDENERTDNAKYIKRIIRYRINSSTGEKEMIEEPIEHILEEPMSSIKEEIIELPLNKLGKRRFIKRIIKYITRVNPITGESEVIEDNIVEEPIEKFDKPIYTIKEEIVEIPTYEPGKKRFIKKIIRSCIKINPDTGEREILDENQIQNSSENPTEKPKVSTYSKRIIKYKFNSTTGQEEVIHEQNSNDLVKQDLEESVITVVEGLVEVPSNKYGKKAFAKRIIKYLTKINTTTGEKEVFEEESIVEPIEQESGKPVVIIREAIVEVPSKGSNRKSFIKKIIRYLIKINIITGEKEIVGKQQFEEPIINVKEEIVDIPTEEINTNYSKRITRYRINPVTGEREIINEQELKNKKSEGQYNGRETEGIKEEIVEIPSNEIGKSKFIKRTIKYTTRINPITGKKEIKEEDPIEETVEQSAEPETYIKKEIIEVPSDVPGKTKIVKRTNKYIYRVNPYTGEKEIVGEQTFDEPYEYVSKEVVTFNEEIVEAPYSEPSKKRYMKRTIKYITKVNLTTGEKNIVGKQQMDKPIQDSDKPVTLIKEEIVEVPSEIQDKRNFIKRIIKYVIDINPVTNERKIIERQSIEEPIESFKYLNLSEVKFTKSEEDDFTEGNSVIDKLKSSLLANNNEENYEINYDETVDEESYNGKELIDQIKNALTFDDVKSDDISDLDNKIIPSSTEDKKEIIYKNYKEYENYIDNESATYKNQYESSYNHLTDQNNKTIDEEKILKRLPEHDDEYIVVENNIIEQDVIPEEELASTNEKHYLKRKPDLNFLFTNTNYEDTEKTNIVDESKTVRPKTSKKQIESSLEDATCCGVKKIRFDKKSKIDDEIDEQKEKVEVVKNHKNKESRRSKSFRKRNSKKIVKKENENEDDIYINGASTVVESPKENKFKSYFDNDNTNDKHCIIM
jgi:hypothetical protein